LDVENEASNPRKRARLARNHRADGEEADSPFDAKELEERVRRHGRKFVILCGLWLALGTGDCEAFFKTPLNDEYDPELRFGADDPDSDEHEARQGQLREIREILADDLLPFLSSPWVAKAVCFNFSCLLCLTSSQFDDGMRSQRYHTAHRLRHDAITHILMGLKVNDQEVNTSQLSTSQSRVLHFAVSIGWNETNSKYRFWDIPFLHGNESRTLDHNELFRHPLLLKVCF
jgi:hypothetical protein